MNTVFCLDSVYVLVGCAYIPGCWVEGSEKKIIGIHLLSSNKLV